MLQKTGTKIVNTVLVSLILLGYKSGVIGVVNRETFMYICVVVH